jgi:alpha-ketoglutarate-dependent taurine dioxygenase
MTNIPILKYESLEALTQDIEAVASRFRESSIFCIRGLNLSREEQLQFTRNLGDIFNWVPSNSHDFVAQYIESHSRSPKVPTAAGDEIVVGWHIEHPDFDNYTPLVVGVWNMQKFTCSPNVGMTYFMDSRDVYETLFSEEEKDFLRKSESCWMEQYEDDQNILNNAKVVARHWIDGRELIRIEMHQLETTKLFKFDGKEPSVEQEEVFQSLVSKFVDEVYKNEELRIVHQWQKGDILVPDLFALIHAVTGGFFPEQREFTGYWCHLGIYSGVGGEKVHPSWRRHYP